MFQAPGSIIYKSMFSVIFSIKILLLLTEHDWHYFFENLLFQTHLTWWIPMNSLLDKIYLIFEAFHKVNIIYEFSDVQ